ncbi:LexA family transcriptional regulator [Legionella sp.]|uniref:LexA family transcriptional regulator n=1 Tax=Legionella sp. TaxID=459 RepID=UPI000CBE623C|nr:LexA family transcriptional regulator [Legionella sp.]PJE14681.1 MAG: XRE family transcriptional regulator [Legionella sp.]
MNSNDSIGSRITQARKANGITIKELSARTETLGATRISNWEQGTRNPGPEEAKLLSKHLQVAASWLLCLTDNPQGELLENGGNCLRCIPVLSLQEAPYVNEILTIRCATSFPMIVIDSYNPSIKHTSLFAVTIEDNSMHPDFYEGNVVIIDVELSPKPGNFVLAYQSTKKQTVLRKYCETDNCLFKLMGSSELRTTVGVRQDADVKILGVVVESRKYS